MYRIDIMTLFPDTVGDVLSESILGRAQERDILRIDAHQIRDYTLNKQKQVDDYPYGGGRGAVMQADPLYQCWEHIRSRYDTRPRTIYLSPCGRTFTQADAKRLAWEHDHLILVCGHYEGIDQRFIDACVDEEISLGDFVLTGGEIAAMAVADAVCRLVPGVLSDRSCYENESHWDGLLEYPQYSRPEVWHGRSVPPELLTGDHAKVERWRRKQSLLLTRERRPDLYETLDLSSKSDQKLLAELEREQSRPPLPRPPGGGGGHPRHPVHHCPGPGLDGRQRHRPVDGGIPRGGGLPERHVPGGVLCAHLRRGRGGSVHPVHPPGGRLRRHHRRQMGRG